MNNPKELQQLWNLSQLLQSSWGAWVFAPSSLTHHSSEGISKAANALVHHTVYQVRVATDFSDEKRNEAVLFDAGVQLQKSLEAIAHRKDLAIPPSGFTPPMNEKGGYANVSIIAEQFSDLRKPLDWFTKQGEFADVSYDSSTAILVQALSDHARQLGILTQKTKRTTDIKPSDDTLSP